MRLAVEAWPSHADGAQWLCAGTGKTETVKELAKCLGKQCVVFNTTEQLESGHLTRLLMGVISTGAWACFDEFNRMDMEVRRACASGPRAQYRWCTSTVCDSPRA